MNLGFLNTAFNAVSARPGIVIAAGTATIVGGSTWAICKTFKAVRVIDEMQSYITEKYIEDGDYWEDTHVYSKKDIIKTAGKMYIGPAIVVLAGIGMVACGLHWLGGIGVVLSTAPAAAKVVDKIADVPVQAKTAAPVAVRDENQINDDGDCAENTGYGRYLFREPITGRMFYSDKATIRQSVNNIDSMFGSNGEASLADFFTEMCMDMCDSAYEYLWVYDAVDARHIEAHFENYELNKTDCPCLNICWSIDPYKEH